MKKLNILILAVIFLSTIGYGQNADPSININMTPATVSLYTTGVLNVVACNNGPTPIVANSLRIVVSVGLNAQIMGVQAGSDPRYTVETLGTGAGNTITMTNTGVGTIGFLDCPNINLIVKGKVVAPAATITGTIGYISGGNPLLPGNAQSSSQGNLNSGNNNSTTSLTVTTFLPIKLESFNGKLVNCKTELDWKTSAEDDLKNYEVEYSTDGTTFTGVGIVPAKGKNGGGSSYSFSHTAKNGIAYYRLKSVDNNTAFSYSNVINVTRSCDKRTVNIYPNPSSDNMVVGIDNPVYDAGNSETGILYNSAGKEVRRFVFQNGTNNIDVSKFASGSYVLTIVSTTGNESFPVIIK